MPTLVKLTQNRHLDAFVPDFAVCLPRGCRAAALRRRQGEGFGGTDAVEGGARHLPYLPYMP